MEKIFKSKWFDAAVISILAALVLVVYSNTYNASFQFDDAPNIINNYQIKDLSNTREILGGNRGVTFFTFALNYAFGGLDVTGFHVVNTLIHILNGVLVYFLLFKTFVASGMDEPWSRKIAAYSALLFAVHPIQTQTVTYIIQRMEGLASCFYLAALLCFLAAVKAKGSKKRLLLYACVPAAYYLGFNSKETAITLPAIILLYDLFFLSGFSLKRVAGRWPLYALLALMLVYFSVSTIIPLGGFSDLSPESAGLGAVAASGAPSAGFGVSSITPWEYLLTQFNVLVYYMALLLVPINQNLDYDFPISSGLFDIPVVNEGTVLNIPIPPAAVSLVILVAIIAAAIYLSTVARNRFGGRARIVSFFIFWFFILLSPTSSFIPILDVIFEHRLYLPSLGFFVIFSIGFDRACDLVGRCRAAGNAEEGEPDSEPG